MTREQRDVLRHGGIVEPTVVGIPVLPNKCVATPTNIANEGFPKPLTQEDYNAIPIADQEAMSKYRGADDLHKADMIAAEHSKGTKLKAIAKVQGKQKFAQNYKINLPN